MIKYRKKLSIYFVIKFDYENENNTSNDMKLAFTRATDWNLKPKWIKECECIAINGSEKGTVFVFEEFNGDTFNKFFTSNKNAIIGPKCVLTCFTGNIAIPNTESAVYNMAMNELSISTSNLSLAQKKRIKELVGFMGGEFTYVLTTSTTHLVVSSVLSEKYLKASANGIPVMKADWVEQVWKLNLESGVKATDCDVINSYKCPMFHNLLITASQLSINEKNRIKEIVNDGGGQYSPDLEKNKTNVLIIPIAEGKKYKCAKLWNVKCLKPSWIDQCLEKGYAVPTEDYIVHSSSNCSTPVNSMRNQKMAPLIDTNDSELSVIPFVNEKSIIGETASERSDVSDNKIKFDNLGINKFYKNNEANIFKTPVKNLSKNNTSKVGDTDDSLSYRQVLDKIEISEVKKCGSLLDGCKVFLAGFTLIEEEKLRRILNYGGAVRFTELNESITHIIIGDPNNDELQHIQRIPNKPHVVKVEWLSTSIKQGYLMKEGNCAYSLGSKEQRSSQKSKELQQPSPLSKKGLQILNPVKNKQCGSDTDVSVDRNLVEKYFQPEELGIVIPKLELVENNRSENNAANNRSQTKEQSLSSEPDSKLFVGFKFAVIGHNLSTTGDIKNAIVEYGGTVVSGSRTVIDYTIVPFSTIPTKITSNEIVTGLWLEECIFERKIVDAKYYHRPVTVPDFIDAAPLHSCTITFSSYNVHEKQYLENIATFMGAKCQEMLSKKQIDDKGLVPTTHLICATPQGVKFTAAKKWNLPIIREVWLLECFKFGLMLPVENFLLVDNKSSGETACSSTHKKAIDRVDKTKVAVNTKCKILQPVSAIEKMNTLMSADEFPKNISNASATRFGNIETVKNIELSKQVEKTCKSSMPSTSTAVHTVLQNSFLSKQNLSSVSKSNQRGKTSSTNTNYPTGLLLEINASSKRCVPGVKRKLNSPIGTTYSRRRGISSPKKKAICLVDHSSPFEEVGWQDTLTDLSNLQTQPDSNIDEIDEALNRVDNGEDQLTQPSIRKNFMISIFETNQVNKREYYENIVKKLDGNVLSCYRNDCDETEKATHLVIDELKKTEKLLCSIASGLWILHPSYLERSDEQLKFVSEEEFEWGNPKAENLLVNASKNNIMLAKAAHRWRKTIKDGGLTKRSFVDMNVVIIGSETDNIVESLTRLVQSGGGNVLPTKDIFNATHCLVKSDKHLVNIPIPLEQLAERKIHCLQAVYLSDCLIYDPPPDPKKCYFDVYKRLIK